MEDKPKRPMGFLFPRRLETWQRPTLLYAGRLKVGWALFGESTVSIEARSDGMVLEEFGWFGGILEKFVREKHCPG